MKTDEVGGICATIESKILPMNTIVLFDSKFSFLFHLFHSI